jgi:hypothetical protein
MHIIIDKMITDEYKSFFSVVLGKKRTRLASMPKLDNPIIKVDIDIMTDIIPRSLTDIKRAIKIQNIKLKRARNMLLMIIVKELK